MRTVGQAVRTPPWTPARQLRAEYQGREFDALAHPRNYGTADLDTTYLLSSTTHVCPHDYAVGGARDMPRDTDIAERGFACAMRSALALRLLWRELLHRQGRHAHGVGGTGKYRQTERSGPKSVGCGVGCVA